MLTSWLGLFTFSSLAQVVCCSQAHRYVIPGPGGPGVPWKYIGTVHMCVSQIYSGVKMMIFKVCTEKNRSQHTKEYNNVSLIYWVAKKLLCHLVPYHMDLYVHAVYHCHIVSHST